MKALLLSLTIITTLISFNSSAANRYWVSNVASNWNNTANWSTSNGGASGASVPVAGDYVYFNANGSGDCDLDVNVAIDGIRLRNYTGTINLEGYSFNPTTSGTADVIFESGTISDTPGTSSVTFTTTNQSTFSGTTFNTPINVTAGRVRFNGGTYNNPVIAEDNGGSSTNGNGGCIFNSTLKVTNSGTSYFLMGYTLPDVFNDDVTFINTSTSRIRIAFNSAANIFNGNIIVASNSGSGIWFGENGGTSSLADTKIIQLDAAGFTAGELRFRNFIQLGGTAQSITLAGTSFLRTQTGTTFNGNVNFTSPRITIDGSTFAGTSSFEKTDGSHDYSSGGNTFTGNALFTNNGSGYIVLGNGAADTFLANVTLQNNGSSNIYLANTGAGNSIAGNLIANNAGTGGNTHIIIANQSSSSLAVNGNATFNNTSNSTSGNIIIADNGDITFNGTVNITNAPVGTSGSTYLANSSNSAVTIAGATVVTNSGSGTTKRMYLGNYGDITFNGTLDITNTCTATNSEVYCNNYSNSVNTYNQNITVSSSSAGSDGIRFGQSNGSGTLANGKTITIGAGGYSQGLLQFRNFTQTGSTAHNLTLTGNGYFTNYDSDWGGNVSFIAPRMNTRGTTYNGTTYLEKTGAIDDASAGGNHFVGNTELRNSGSRYFLMGNGNSDAFDANLTINNTGTYHMYLAYNSAGNTVGGNLTVNNTSTGSNGGIYISTYSSSTLAITGNTSITNTSSATTANIYLGDNGDANIGGSLTINNNPTSTTGQVLIANNTNSTVTVNGATTASNNGGSTTKRIYFGNNGDVTFNGTLDITNNASATNSEVYCSIGANSSNMYNQNITVSSTHASGDGIRFGQNGGTGTLATGKTITVSGSGFIAGDLEFRNFTQTGNIAQNITLTGTSRIYNYGANWGGNATFIAPRIITRGTTYNGTSYLEKTGSTNDASAGGNTFSGNTELKNSGSGYFMMGNGSPDIFSGNVILNNTGTRTLYLARNSTSNSIAGTLTANNTGSGSTSQIIISEDSSSTLTVNGNATFTNTTSGNNGDILLGSNGDINFNGTLSLTNNTTGTNGHIFVANRINSTVNIAGTTTVQNSGAGTTKRTYLGNYGDINFNGALDITNSASATNSEIFLNYRSSSVNTYNQNITIKSTHASCDGIRFGQNGGSGTLAATKTISIPGVDALNFIGGQLRFQNFTQIGATAHSFELGSTASYIYNYNSTWGGNTSFIAPRILIRGSSFAGTSYFEKTGGGDDASIGGNTFTGNTELKNSGSRYFLMGNGSADIFNANLTMNNTGAYILYVAYNSVGNTVGGDLTVSNSGTGSNSSVYLSSSSSSTLSVAGNTTISNTTSGTNGTVCLGDYGDVTLNGDLSLTNNASGTNGLIIIGNRTNSAIVIAGNTSVSNSGGGTTKRTYLGNGGDITFNGTLDMVNNATSANSEIYCNYSSNSSNAYNGNITVSTTHASNDGIRFGEAGGNGTLAATKTITIPGVDAANFIGGQLRFQNFTQVGNTAHSFELGATATYIYNYNSSWGGNTSFIAPRILTRTSTFSGTSHFEKIGSSNDYSYGGNTFGGNTELILNNNIGSGSINYSNNVASSVGGSLLIQNMGSFGNLVYGNLAGAYPINGDLTIINSTSGTSGQDIYLGNNAGSAFNVTGNLVVTNSSTGTSGTHNILVSNNGSLTVSGNATTNNIGVGGATKRIYLGNRGDFFIGGTLDIDNNSSASTAEVILANYTESTASIGGNTTVSNNGGGSYKRCFLGNYGDVTFSGNLGIVNNASATRSEIYCNDRAGSVNTYNGNITVKATHASGDGIRFGENGGSGTLAASKTISIPGVDAVNYIGGNLTFRNFTQIGATPQSFELGSTANYIYNRDCNWGGDVSFTAPRMYTQGSTYSGTSYFEKTGSSNDALVGGNTFVGNTTIKNSGNNYFLFGNGTADVFQANVDLQNTGSNHIYLAYRGAGHTIAGNLTATNSATGTGDYRIYIAGVSDASLSISGNVTINQDGNGKTLRSYLGDYGDLTIDGNVNINNSGTGTTSQITLGNTSNSALLINGTSTITNNSTASNSNRIYVGNSGDIIFNGVLNLVNNAGTNESEIYLNYASNSSNMYNQNITVATYDIASDGILFGVGGGNGTLASGKNISIPGVDATNYTGGQLYFRNFTQIGGAAQTLELGPNASYFQSYSCTWNGNLDIKGPRMYTRSSTFNGNAAFTKTGGQSDYMYGGNAFAGTTSYTNQGAGLWRIANNVGNDYNGNTVFAQASTGTLDPAYNTLNTFAGNITVNSGSIIRFGRAGNGRVVMDGNAAQSINKIGATATPQFRDLQTLNASSEITLNTPISILTDLDLDQGNIITTATNIIYVNDNAVVSSASSSAFVDGPIIKIGNDAFTFPVGNAGLYAPMSISNPSSTSARFEGEYIHNSPESDGFDTTSISAGIDHVSETEYWLLNRIASSNNVKVTLGWENTRSGDLGTGTLCDIRVARWNGTKWTNEGNGGTTGAAANGTVTTGTSENCATTTNITTWVNDYPITLATDSNYIIWDGTSYDGGSGTGGAPSTADAGRILKVYAPGAVVTADAMVDKVIITAAGEITIESGIKATVNGIINNNGSITVENNASLIQTTAGADANSGSGTYTVKRTGNTSNASYNIWSTPLKSASITSVFTGANPCDMWVFDGTTQTWTHDFAAGYTATCNGNNVTFTASDVIAGGDGIMDQARGYFVPGAVVSTKQFDGTVNNGDISIAINNTNLGNQPFWNDDDWNLVGNPYPSAISANAFWTENAINNARITDAIYFWDDGDSASGYNQNSDYASWNALGGVNSGNSAVIPSGNISTGQGFWVVANSNTNLVFNNSMRGGANDQFFKTDGTDEKHLAWLSVETPTGYVNNILVGYSDLTTDGIDPLYDAHKLAGNAHIRFATMIGNEEFSIQGIQKLNIGSSKVIPLVIFTDESGVHTVSKYRTENLPANIIVYIKDLDSGITHDLTTSDFSVSFTANTEYKNRFELVFENSINNNGGGSGPKGSNGNGNGGSDSTVTGIDNTILNQFVLATNANGYVLANKEGFSGDIIIIDVTGKVIWTKTDLENTTSVNINLNGISSGMYILEVRNGTERVYQNKILKQ